MNNIQISDCVLFNNRRPQDSEKVKRASYKDISFYGTIFKDIVIRDNECVFVYGEGELAGGTGPKIGNDSGIAFVISRNNADGTYENVLIENNRCTAHYRHGIVSLYGFAAPVGSSTTNNICDNNGWLGIYVAITPVGSVQNVLVTTNERLTITENYCNYNGFFDYDSDNDTIRGGIVVSGVFNTVISNNVCMRNGDTTLGITPATNSVNSAGIRLRGDEIDIEGNTTGHNKDCGITTWSSPSFRMSILGNRSFENDKDGILFQGKEVADLPDTGRGFLVNDNVCTRNDGSGIKAFWMNGALVSSNYCRCNGDHGIRLNYDGDPTQSPATAGKFNTDNIYLFGNLVAYSSGTTPISPDPPRKDSNNVYTSNVTFVDSSC